MLTRTVLALSAGVLLGAAVAAPTAAFAQFGPPPGPPPMLAGPPPMPAGPPPGLGAGGPPPGLAGGPPLRGAPAGLPPRDLAGGPPRDLAGGPAHLDAAGGLRGIGRGEASLRGIEGRAAAYGGNSYTHNSYANYGGDRGYGRAYRYGAYAAAAAYGYASSYASSDDGCYYVSTRRRYGTRSVLVCRGN